jgi:Fic family protein
MKMPESPPQIDEVVAEILKDGHSLARIMDLREATVDSKGRYLHWDDMRSRQPPKGLTRQQWWLATDWARRAVSRELPLKSVAGAGFRFSNVDPVQEAVHSIDQQASGRIIADDLVTNLRSSTRYLVSSLVEEAITSSQLEGASTTRRVAKEMLETGRRPRDLSEQMILSNYKGLLFAQGMTEAPLTPGFVLTLHRLLTEDTMSPEKCGRLQTEDDDRIAVLWHDGTVLHQPPPAKELEERLEAMCRFANAETPDGFLHPVVRAIILHFWLAYDHPFADGNGRTARALFYWAMLHNDYWLAQYLSVSSILRKAPSQYARCFLLTESDNSDVTYFVIYQLGVIERAVNSLHEYLGRKIAESREIDQMFRGSSILNQRQVLVVRDALRDPGEPFTYAAQARRNGVTHQTSRTDLLGLEKIGLLTKTRHGNKHVFRAPQDLAERLRQLGGAA